MWTTTDNFTIQYKGNNAGYSIAWLVTFYRSGSNLFLVEVMSTLPGASSQLCQNNNCYQQLTSSPMMYRVCDIGCFDCLDKCTGTADCQLKCPMCFAAGSGCVNWLAIVVVVPILVVLVATILAVGIGAARCLKGKQCCGMKVCCRGCLSCRACCCECCCTLCIRC